MKTRKEKFSALTPVPRAWIFSDAELCKIYSVLEKANSDPNNADPIFLMRLALGAGLRRGEFIPLTTDDCSRDGWIHIRRAKGGKQRDVRIMPELMPYYLERLDSYRVKSSGLLFPPEPGNPPRTSTYAAFVYWHRALTLCQMQCGWTLPRHNLHRARHTYASWEMAMGRLNIHELAANLGHTSVSITEQYYLHMVRELVYTEDRRPQWIRAALGKHWSTLHSCRRCQGRIVYTHKFCPHCGEKLHIDAA